MDKCKLCKCEIGEYDNAWFFLEGGAGYTEGCDCICLKCLDNLIKKKRDLKEGDFS